ncbi:response regulator transcription factor [bacterium]|nr:response regulator transcription factor [bacterium]
MNKTGTILIVDDQNDIRDAWTDALEKQGYRIETARSAIEAESLFKDEEFSLAMVNLRSNGHVRGLDMLDWIKENNPSTDVILVTDYSAMDSSISAVRKGAYDYLVKPINVAEMVTRVNRCMSEREEALERLQMINQIEMMLNQLKANLVPEVDEHSADHIIETPNIIVDRRKRLVVQNGEPVQLSPTEFDMLDYLASNGDRVVSASELIRAVQGYDMEEHDARPIVRVNVRRLRQKIEEDTSNPRHILTVRSRGYRFAA